VGFTFLAQIVIGADHTLITDADYLLLAAVATGGMMLTAVMPDDKSLRVCDLDEVVWVLLGCDCKACPARIVVRAVQAFVSITVNMRVAHVTDGVVQDGLWFGLWNWRSRRRGLTGYPFAFAAEDGVNDDATRLLDFKELMGHGMATSPVCDARSAHIVVRAVKALMPNTADGRLADIADDSCMNG
jgi:hypothetical protein